MAMLVASWIASCSLPGFAIAADHDEKISLPTSTLTSTPARPRIGLVLSGGGARGAAHIGVLKVLEELRVPIDFIAGTSMGAIVGAGYASGTSIVEMEEVLQGITTGDLYREALPRRDQTIHRKKDDGDLYIGPELGIRGGTLRLPKGVVSGIRLESVLRRLSKAQGFVRFDDLPIPFRAVATDIGSGDMVVLEEGELASVMRASMSVPGAIAPAQIDGRALLDGGLVRNLPVDVVRAMGADIVIAVNLGTPLLKQEDISSIVGVTLQMINIMGKQNVRASLASLAPEDVLIAPELGNYSASDFDHMRETIPIGEAAARKVSDRLSRLSLSEADYAAFRAHRILADPPQLVAVHAIRFDGLERASPEVLLATMQTRPGKPIDRDVLDDDMRRLYGRGDFESIDYRIVDQAGRRVLAVDAREKSWGPDYVRVGVALVADFPGDAYFNLGARYRRPWLNALGGELRVDGQVGHVDRLASEFYQPIDTAGRFFVAPYFALDKRPLDLFAGQDRIARFNFRTSDIGLDVGGTVTKYGELRVGVLKRHVKSKLDIGLPPFFTDDNVRQNAVRARLLFDQLDSLDFPRSGAAATLNLFGARNDDDGAGKRYVKYDVTAQAAHTIGRHTLQLAFEARGAATGQLPAVDLIQFGGFQQLSGYRTGQLLGTKLVFGSAAYLYRLRSQPLLEGIYVGASLEAGRIRHVPLTGAPTGLLLSTSIFLGLDTPLGPLYVAYGRARDGNSSGYVFLGRP